MTSTANTLLADIRALTPAVAARAEEIEAAGRIPKELIDGLRQTGLFRSFVPRSFGGLELDIRSVVRALIDLARADASVGWVAAIGAGSGLAASLLPRALYEEVYRTTPDVASGGSTQATGRAEKVEGGWRVSGRWAFASGCQDLDWLCGMCVMTEGGQPLPGPVPGMPMLRGFVLPREAWQIENSWHVPGLRGTGSHHIRLSDVVVPDDQFFDLMNGKPCLPEPLYAVAMSVLPFFLGSIPIGIAEGALDDLIAIVKGGRHERFAPAPMRDSEFFHGELGRVQAEIRAARALVEATAADAWERIQAGSATNETLAPEVLQSIAWSAATCARAVDTCFTFGGSHALYDPSSLQRRMRDMHTAGQHATFHPRQFIRAGARLVKEPPAVLTAAA